jgi:uncharacterized protein (TIGR02996 family)
MGEKHFLDAIGRHPADSEARAEYAAWLERRPDADSRLKAQFLRLTLRKRDEGGLLQELAAQLDPKWTAIVASTWVERCLRKRQEGDLVSESVFQFKCERKWDELEPTSEPTVRFCNACEQSVYYCDTIIEARREAWSGHCIAIDLGVLRRQRDLDQRPGLGLGRPDPKFLAQEEERMKPDAISLERELRKRRVGEARECERQVIASQIPTPSPHSDPTSSPDPPP